MSCWMWGLLPWEELLPHVFHYKLSLVGLPGPHRGRGRPAGHTALPLAQGLLKHRHRVSHPPSLGVKTAAEAAFQIRMVASKSILHGEHEDFPAV